MAKIAIRDHARRAFGKCGARLGAGPRGVTQRQSPSGAQGPCAVPSQLTRQGRRSGRRRPPPSHRARSMPAAAWCTAAPFARRWRCVAGTRAPGASAECARRRAPRARRAAGAAHDLLLAGARAHARIRRVASDSRQRMSAARSRARAVLNHKSHDKVQFRSAFSPGLGQHASMGSRDSGAMVEECCAHSQTAAPRARAAPCESRSMERRLVEEDVSRNPPLRRRLRQVTSGPGGPASGETPVGRDAPGLSRSFVRRAG